MTGTWTERRHQHSVLGVAQDLHGYVTGASDWVHEETPVEFVEWLAWRVETAWEPPAMASTRHYDRAVREVARSVLCMVRLHVAQFGDF